MKFKWNLRLMMVKNEINTSAELRRRLSEIGVEISSAQITRVVNEMPSRISTVLLMGLIRVLNCTPNDLMGVEVDDNEEPSTSNVKQLHVGKTAVEKKPPSASRRKPTPKDVVDDIASLTGGKARPYPVKGRDDT
ncbi:helix-turn-helix domain-containing protein [Mariprofundus ferrooxydans]|uniref:helix-turn-helix domain-containing protein n=1 Tax=Mariprofundus ferrooxydans TaxID=314344 RepID=UPI0006A6AC45|nr:helix-turn-helix transcriptional regulator [Mariprofundus ferrooxydans]